MTDFFDREITARWPCYYYVPSDGGGAPGKKKFSVTWALPTYGEFDEAVKQREDESNEDHEARFTSLMADKFRGWTGLKNGDGEVEGTGENFQLAMDRMEFRLALIRSFNRVQESVIPKN